MPIDYTVASLQPLAFDGPAPYTWDRFMSMMPEGFEIPDAVAGTGSPRWREIETGNQLITMATATGKIVAVNGNMITVAFSGAVAVARAPYRSFARSVQS